MKQKFAKRLGSLLLVMLLILGTFPMAAFADGPEEIAAPVVENAVEVAPAADSSSAAPAASCGETPAPAPAPAPASSGGETPAAAPASSSGETPAAAPAAAADPVAPAASEGSAPAEETPASESPSAEPVKAPAEKAVASAAPATETAQPSETISADDKTPASASDEKTEAKSDSASKDAAASKASAAESVSAAAAPAESVTADAATAAPAEPATKAAPAAQPAETVSAEAPAAVTNSVLPAMKTVSLKLAAPAAKSTTGSDISLTVEIGNIINSLHSDEKGHIVLYNHDLSFSPTQSKAIEHNGTYSFVGGANYKTSDFGVNYRFQNQFILNDDNDGPVLLEEGETIPESQRIKRIANNGNGTVTITHADGSTETKEADSNNKIKISPVYVHVPAWRLEYNYIDNVSTGSGSWSNLDAIVSYTHTFSDPSVKTPVQDYQFVEWKNDASGETYKAGDKYTYSGTELKPGQIKQVYTYAYWQPVAEVDYYNAAGDLDKSVRSFEENGEIKIYDYTYN